MVSDIPGIVERLKSNPKSVRFAELCKVCEHYFGEPRQKGTSHMKFKTGMKDAAMIIIQPDGKMAKAYQCKQVAKAIEMKEAGL